MDAQTLASTIRERLYPILNTADPRVTFLSDAGGYIDVYSDVLGIDLDADGADDLAYAAIHIITNDFPEVICPGCEQKIVVSQDEAGEFYSECGGEGDGGCAVWIDGSAACAKAHAHAINLARA